MVVLVLPLGWLSDSTWWHDGWVDLAMSSVLGLIGIVAPHSVHLLIFLIHGTSGQPFPSTEH